MPDELEKPASETPELDEALESIAIKYDCSMSDWNQLSWRLAKAHEPAIKALSRKYQGKDGGRPKEWDGVRTVYLWFDVEQFFKRTRDQKPSISAACKFLAKQEFWNGTSEITLKTNYTKFVRHSPLVILFQRLSEQLGWETFLSLTPEMFALENRKSDLDWERKTQKSRSTGKKPLAKP